MKTGGSDGDGERRWNEKEDEEGAAGRAGEEGTWGEKSSGRVRGKKGDQGVEASGNAMGSLPGMKNVGIDLFKA